jgi:hypothetical protein
MRRSTSLLGISLITLLLNLIFSSEAEACWRARLRLRCRHQENCDAGVIPSWVRWMDQKVACPAGYHCMCCENGELVQCGPQCDPGSQMCINNKSTIGVSCAKDLDRPAASDGKLYAMICDCTFHRLRFAFPGEEPDGLFPIRFLCTPCTLSKK